MRGQEERRAAAERHVVRVEMEREEQARSAVVEERARIARELHDAVAHSVSVMVLQAGGVRRLLGADPAREREREALAGSRRPAARRSASCTACSASCARPRPELAPSPSLRRVDELVEQVRGAGLDATLDVQGEPAELAPGVDMSAYRIVQEALTNALRYAPGATVGVTVIYGRELQLVVADDGARVNGGARHAGLRPRHRRHARARRAVRRRAGGGPGAGRRFPVRARLPLMSTRVVVSPMIRRSCAPG